MLWLCILFGTIAAHKELTDGVTPPKGTPLDEVDGEIPAGDKNFLYYFIIAMFVASAIVSTLVTGAFLVAILFLWKRFKAMKFFWFLSMLTLSIFILSIVNLIINVPAALFASLAKDFAKSDGFLFMSYIIDICHYTILFSNLVIAVQRFFVFFFRNIADSVFETPFIFAWLGSIWVCSIIVVYAMMNSNCRYKYTEKERNYVLFCQSTTSLVTLPPPKSIQILEIAILIILPCIILGIYIALTIKIKVMKKASLSKPEITILKQAFFIFFIFQISSVIFLLCQTLKFGITAAFLIKRMINTMEIIAGAATPCFFFFTSKEIRKIVSTRVTAATSQANSQNRPTNNRGTSSFASVVA